MKRILHVVTSLELGGTEAFIMNHYRCLNREEIQFDFLVCCKKEWPYLKEIEELGGRVFYTARPSVLCIRSFYAGMKRAIKEGGPYIAIHCHADADNAVPVLCGLLCGVKKRIAHMHAIDVIPSRPDRKLFHYVKKGLIKLCATDFWACTVAAGVSLYGAVFEKKGRVIKNGILVDRFLKEERDRTARLRSDFHIDENEHIVIGNISRFDENKNQLFLVDVFKNLLDKHSNAVLLLGGTDGGMLNEVKAYVATSALEDKVRFIGKRNDVADCLKLIDVYVFPSVYEGLGIAFLEAQAAGCLCVASTGVPCDTDMGLATAHYLELSDGARVWAEFISEKIDTRKIPAQANIRKAFIEANFDINESCKELVKHYE